MDKPAASPDAPAHGTPHPPPEGRWFEDFELGASFLSPARTITESDVVQFAALSGDYNPLHTDAQFAARTPFRERVAHGMLVQSISTGLGSRMGIFEGTVAALQGMRIEYRAPVRFGDTVHLCLEVLEIDPEPSRRRGWIRFRSAVRNQREEIVIDGEWRTLMLRRPRRESHATGGNP